MIEEKEITINVPANLTEVNIAQMIVYMKVMRMENLSDTEMLIQLLASSNNLDVNHVRKIPIKEILDLGGKLLNAIQGDDTEYAIEDLLIVEIQGKQYGLDYRFDEMETGAYIDITTDIMPDIDNKLHNLMAVLYRPIIEIREGDDYVISKYSTEDNNMKEAREDLFLKHMPYSTVRAVVNFMSSLIAN